MAMLVVEPEIEERLKAERQASGADQFDEVWDGVYIMSPIANIEHQFLVMRLALVFQSVLDAGGGGMVFPGVNVSDRSDDWKQNFRCPDVAVFLTGTEATPCDTHWRGGPDFAVEIVSPGDRTREKLAFYAKVGVRELLIIDRVPWALVLYRLDEGELQPVGCSTPDDGLQLQSGVLPLNFRLVPGDARAGIDIAHHDGRQCWRI